MCDKMVGFWLSLPVVSGFHRCAFLTNCLQALLEYLWGARFHVTGDHVAFSEPAVIIMNHRTRLDWLFFWSALYKLDPWLLTSEKISLKSALKIVWGASESCLALQIERHFSQAGRWNAMHLYF
jgi:lysocardiolipin and lysophospholipid acyltransferase